MCAFRHCVASYNIKIEFEFDEHYDEILDFFFFICCLLLERDFLFFFKHENAQYFASKFILSSTFFFDHWTRVHTLKDNM